MELLIKGTINKEFAISSVQEAIKLLKIPESLNLNIYIIDNIKYCPITSKHLHGTTAERFKALCKSEQNSMALSYKKNNIVIIHIRKYDTYLKTNKKALIGAILHELMHIIYSNKGLDKKIKEDAIKSFSKFNKIISKELQLRKSIIQFYADIGEHANYVLKDIYANAKLIDMGLAEYIIEDYCSLYYRKCQKPKFYNKLKSATLSQIKKAIKFQLNILSVKIPLHTINKKKARNLIKHLEKCYEIREIAEEMKAIEEIATISNNKIFRQKFFNLLFKNILHILEKS